MSLEENREKRPVRKKRKLRWADWYLYCWFWPHF